MSLQFDTPRVVGLAGFRRAHWPANNLEVEVFPTREAAEARVQYWQGLGQHNVWLHEVHGMTVSDKRIGGAGEMHIHQDVAGWLYVLVKVG